jgi:hypothetical protein
MKQTHNTKRTHHRRGSLLTEGVIACIILGVAISMLVPALAAISRQRQAFRFDSLAMVELNNISSAIKKPNLQLVDIKVSDWFSARYSDASLTVDLLPEPDDASKDSLEGVRLTIQRPQAEFMPDQTVSIVVWRAKGDPAP